MNMITPPVRTCVPTGPVIEAHDVKAVFADAFERGALADAIAIQFEWIGKDLVAVTTTSTGQTVGYIWNFNRRAPETFNGRISSEKRHKRKSSNSMERAAVAWHRRYDD